VTIQLRPIKEEEFEAFWRAGSSAFGNTTLENIDDERAIIDFDLTLAGFDGEDIVSTTAFFAYDLSVPGAQVPAAGITWVGVRPTHRRKGLLTQMMDRQLKDVHERNIPVAILWASESLIYPRFGYGNGALGAELRIARGYTDFADPVQPAGRCRLVSRDEALATWPVLYAKRAVVQPGMHSRSETWWNHHSLAKQDPDKAKEATFYVQYEEDGAPLGYVRYTVRSDWNDNFPDGKLSVEELISLTDSAYAALWHYIFGIDLISTYEAPKCRVDEPLFWMLAEPRRLVTRIYDALWVRLVDVPAALEVRGYANEGSIVLDVDDPFCPWNTGRYELQAGPEGAACKATSAKPDLTLTASDLAALYLGGATARTLAQAGRVDGDPDAIARADDLFRWNVTPWCPEVF
jgi:predicted acetyltransferase